MIVDVERAMQPWAEQSFSSDIIAQRQRADFIEREAEQLFDDAIESLLLSAGDAFEIPQDVIVVRGGLRMRFESVLELTQPLTTYGVDQVDLDYWTAIRIGDNALINDRLASARQRVEALARFIALDVEPLVAPPTEE